MITEILRVQRIVAASEKTTPIYEKFKDPQESRSTRTFFLNKGIVKISTHCHRNLAAPKHFGRV